MRWQQVLALGAIATTLVLAAGRPSQAQQFGSSRLPSTFCQYLGWGYGAGHHAPIVRMPFQHPDRVERVRLVSPCNGPLAPAPLQVTGCSSGNCGWGADGGGYGVPMNATPANVGPTPMVTPSPQAPGPAPTPAESMSTPAYRMATRYDGP